VLAVTTSEKMFGWRKYSEKRQCAYWKQL